LDTWQLLEPAGSKPDSGIEVTYQKVFGEEYFKYDIKIRFLTPGSYQILQDPAAES